MSFKCKMCGKIFLSSVGLCNHLDNHIMNEQRRHASSGSITTEVEMPREHSPETSYSDLESAIEIRETKIALLVASANSVAETTVEASGSVDWTKSPEMNVEIISSSSKDIIEVASDKPLDAETTVEASGSVDNTKSPEMNVEIISSSSKDAIEVASGKPLEHDSCHLYPWVFASHSSLEDLLKNVHVDSTSSPEMEVVEATSSSSHEVIEASTKPPEKYSNHLCARVFASHSSLEDRLKNFNVGVSSPEMEVVELTSIISNEAIEATAKLLKRYFHCRFCEKGLKSKSSLAEHLKTVHYIDKLLKCIYCKVRFFKESLLCNHERKFHADKTFHICDVCKKRFFTEVGLHHHKCIHKN